MWLNLYKTAKEREPSCYYKVELSEPSELPRSNSVAYEGSCCQGQWLISWRHALGKMGKQLAHKYALVNWPGNFTQTGCMFANVCFHWGSRWSMFVCSTAGQFKSPGQLPRKCMHLNCFPTGEAAGVQSHTLQPARQFHPTGCWEVTCTPTAFRQGNSWSAWTGSPSMMPMTCVMLCCRNGMPLV